MDNMIAIPKRLRKRPMWHGLPVPYIALIDSDRKPDFRVTDENNRQQVIANCWCQLCGESLGKYMFFVGGTVAAEANAYFEPATHLDCLIYAMQVCPFIAGKIEHAPLEKVQEKFKKQYELGRPVAGGQVVIEGVDNIIPMRNPYWVIKKATGYRLVRSEQGTILLQPEVIGETDPIHAESMTADAWKAIERELYDNR